MTPLLAVDNLAIDFKTGRQSLHAVRGVTFQVKRGEIIAIVGESGCGKSVTAQSITGLLPPSSTKVVSGSIRLNGEELLNCTQKRYEKIRGQEIGMIFQNPMSSLNPTMKIGLQIAEGLVTHRNLSWGEAYNKAIELVALVGIPQPEIRVDQYPHEFSGGMRQRIVIAIALACRPKLLIADEPTTALDVTIQAQILELMGELHKKLEMSIILITHDLGVVAGICHRVLVMYSGQIIEEGSVDDIFYRPSHPYTQLLLKSLPKPGQTRGTPLYSIEGSPPLLTKQPTGCSFTPRCPYAMKGCPTHQPPFEPIHDGHRAACWLHERHKQVS